MLFATWFVACSTTMLVLQATNTVPGCEAKRQLQHAMVNFAIDSIIQGHVNRVKVNMYLPCKGVQCAVEG